MTSIGTVPHCGNVLFVVRSGLGDRGGDGYSTVKAQQGDDNRETRGYVERGLSGGPALVVRREVVKLERLVLMCASYLLLPWTGTTISHQSNFHCSWT